MGEIIAGFLLVCSTACVLLIGLVFLLFGIKRKNKKQIVLSIALPFIYAMAAGGLLIALVVSLTPISGVNVAPREVNFLKLPSTARDVSYWRDGVSFLAEFTVTEKEFLELFSEFKFSEIVDSHEMRRFEFGDSKRYPEASDPPYYLKISNGLHYEKRYSNNGGYEIVYDRSFSRAHYSYSVR